MLSLAHATTGAVIATHIGNPILAIPIILATHYLEDAVCHYDAGTGLSSGRKTRRTALILGIIDLILAALFVLYLYPPASTSLSTLLSHLSSLSVFGAFVGLIPDFLEAPRNFLHYEPKWLKPINKFHASFHHSIPDIAAGLAPQVILLTLLWIFR